MEAKDSLQCSQTPNTAPYPEEFESSLHPHIQILTSIFIFSSYLSFNRLIESFTMRLSEQNFVLICHVTMRATCFVQLI